jgi:hypothetical protein
MTNEHIEYVTFGYGINATVYGVSFKVMESVKDVPIKAGLYMVYVGEEIVYIGESINMRTRIQQHLRGVSKAKHYYKDITKIVYALDDLDKNTRRVIEGLLIREHNPKYNSDDLQRALSNSLNDESLLYDVIYYTRVVPLKVDYVAEALGVKKNVVKTYSTGQIGNNITLPEGYVPTRKLDVTQVSNRSRRKNRELTTV